MDFARILKDFAAAAEVGDGRSFAALFTEDGVYEDAFYGTFQGRDAIAGMIKDCFHRDAEGFRWQMINPVCDGRFGYARWLFSYTSKMPHSAGKRVVMDGVGCFQLRDGLIEHYEDVARTGETLVQLGLPADKLLDVFRRKSDEMLATPMVADHLI